VEQHEIPAGTHESPLPGLQYAQASFTHSSPGVQPTGGGGGGGTGGGGGGGAT